MDKITHKVRCEQWTSIIKECLASGMPKTTWCREHGISDKSFFTGNEFSEKKHTFLLVYVLCRRPQAASRWK